MIFNGPCLMTRAAADHDGRLEERISISSVEAHAQRISYRKSNLQRAVCRLTSTTGTLTPKYSHAVAPIRDGRRRFTCELVTRAPTAQLDLCHRPGIPQCPNWIWTSTCIGWSMERVNGSTECHAGTRHSQRVPFAVHRPAHPKIAAVGR